jgi:hypothetical protein
VLPWWEVELGRDEAPCADEPPDIPPDVVGSINPPPGVGTKLAYNLVALWYVAANELCDLADNSMAYIHVLMSLRLPSLDPEHLTAADVSKEEVRDDLTDLLPFLAERSTVRYESTRDAWGAVWEAMGKGEVSTLMFLLDTVAGLLHPPITTDPPHVAHVLADAWRVCRGGVARKLAFYTAAIQQLGRAEWLRVEGEVRAEAARLRVEMPDEEAEEGEAPAAALLTLG